MLPLPHLSDKQTGQTDSFYVFIQSVMMYVTSKQPFTLRYIHKVSVCWHDEESRNKCVNKMERLLCLWLPTLWCDGTSVWSIMINSTAGNAWKYLQLAVSNTSWAAMKSSSWNLHPQQVKNSGNKSRSCENAYMLHLFKFLRWKKGSQFDKCIIL